MRCIVTYLLGPDGTDNLADYATEDNSVADNLSTATTNGVQYRRGEINNAKIVHAVKSLFACSETTHIIKNYSLH